ncbi:hypothetical protein Dsin_003226 [Dipteronia sinensis]|uniref:Uncharacterized protein n=1 Tax=Dipteronia sinensis TaxID=43782 RepID=A0AAE0B8L8_9ROSI|nr:hypothetical protein Dsin_003226 [Dipteronia sinensis]
MDNGRYHRILETSNSVGKLALVYGRVSVEQKEDTNLEIVEKRKEVMSDSKINENVVIIGESRYSKPMMGVDCPKDLGDHVQAAVFNFGSQQSVERSQAKHGIKDKGMLTSLAKGAKLGKRALFKVCEPFRDSTKKSKRDFTRSEEVGATANEDLLVTIGENEGLIRDSMVATTTHLVIQQGASGKERSGWQIDEVTQGISMLLWGSDGVSGLPTTGNGLVERNSVLIPSNYVVLTSARRSRNTIEGLRDDNRVWPSDQGGMESVVSQFFAKLFYFSSPSLDDIEKVTCSIQAKPSSKSRDFLDWLFTAEEVRKATFDMFPRKAFGLDARPMLIYQKYWAIFW